MSTSTCVRNYSYSQIDFGLEDVKRTFTQTNWPALPGLETRLWAARLPCMCKVTPAGHRASNAVSAVTKGMNARRTTTRRSAVTTGGTP